MTPRNKVRIIVVAALVVCAMFLPEMVSAGWHLVHGRTVTYRSWKVVVPFGWYAVSHGEGMSVERMSEIPWREHPTAEFQPVHFTKTYPFKYDLFGKEQAATLRTMGYLFLEQRDVEVAGKDGRCWTFDNWKNHNRLWIACIVPKDLTSADYSGDRAYANDFFSLLAQSRRNPAAKD